MFHNIKFIVGLQINGINKKIEITMETFFQEKWWSPHANSQQSVNVKLVTYLKVFSLDRINS